VVDHTPQVHGEDVRPDLARAVAQAHQFGLIGRIEERGSLLANLVEEWGRRSQNENRLRLLRDDTLPRISDQRGLP
jgi:hypothetical protein